MNENKNHYHGPALIPFPIYAERVEKLSDENERLRELATKDQLSGALNRHGLEIHLETAKTPKAVILIDATNFKAVNDTYGHNEGDRLIIETFNILRASVRPEDVIARWGGDEFVIILNGDDDAPDSIDENAPGYNEISEERRVSAVHIDHIDPVKQRIAANVNELLEKHPHLKNVNFDLAVGAAEWTGESNIESLIEEVEKELKEHKAEQHQHGQYRQN